MRLLPTAPAVGYLVVAPPALVKLAAQAASTRAYFALEREE